MDGVGFGLEKFDAIGQRREKLLLEFRKGSEEEEEGDHKPVQSVTLPLDTTAYVAGIPDSQFTSPQQLGAVLAKSSQCQECIVKQYFRFQAGRMDVAADRPIIQMVSDKFRDSGYRFKELMVSLMVLRDFPEAVTRQIGPHKQGEFQHVANNHGSR
jgi:hypothetical protein